MKYVPVFSVRADTSPDDLDAQARLRDAFDPDGAANPQKVLPRGSRCGEMQRVPEGAWI